MKSGDIKILENLYINQNVICLIISYIGIVYITNNVDTQNCIVCLTNCLCMILFLVSSISVISTLIVYSIEYWVKKWYRGKEHQVEYENKKSNKTSVNCKRCAKCPCKDCEL